MRKWLPISPPGQRDICAKLTGSGNSDSKAYSDSPSLIIMLLLLKQPSQGSSTSCSCTLTNEPGCCVASDSERRFGAPVTMTLASVRVGSMIGHLRLRIAVIVTEAPFVCQTPSTLALTC